MKISSTSSLFSPIVFLLCVTEWAEAQSPSSIILVEPASSAVHVGEPFQFVCKVNSSITHCTIESPQNLRLFSISTTDHDESRYFGNGLQAGECGVQIKNAHPKLHNGVFRCIMRIQNDVPSTATGISRIIVTPSDKTVPEVQINNEEYVEGSLLSAECTFRSPRPATNLSWFLDDELIRTEMPARPQPKGASLTAFLTGNTNVQENLTRKVSWSDHGKKLKCIAQHFSGDHNHTSTEIEVHVRFAPRPMKNPDLIQKYLGDKNLLLEYILRANPKPRVQWTINNVAVSDLNLEYNDEVTNSLQPGLWQAQLELKIPGKDFANNVSMTATNQLGSQTYHFKMVLPKPDDLTDNVKTDKLTTECEGHGVTAVAILSILLILTIITFIAIIMLLKRKFNRREIELLHRLQVAHRREQARQSRMQELVPEPIQSLSEEYSYISVLDQGDRNVTAAPEQSHESMIYQNIQDGSLVNDNQNPGSPSYVNHPQDIAYVNQK